MSDTGDFDETDTTFPQGEAVPAETGDDAVDDQNEATAFADALNAGRAFTNPGEPPEGPESPADDADIPPPM